LIEDSSLNKVIINILLDANVRKLIQQAVVKELTNLLE